MSEQRADRGHGPFGIPVCQSGWDTVDRVLDDWSRERPDLDFTPVGVVSRLGKVRSHLNTAITAVFASYGLTPADFQVIVTLRRSGTPFRMVQARLMEALELTSGTVSVRLDRLEAAGVVAREPDPASARSSVVRLTEKGIALFDQAAPEHLANEDRLLSALSAAERQQLADLLRRLLSSFERGHALVAVDLGLELEAAPVARQRRQAVGLSDTAGLLITAVRPQSPADQAGLVRGDLITDVDGTVTLSTVTLAELLEVSEHAPLSVGVLRGDERRLISVPITTRTR